MWAKHWCAGATGRVGEMAPRMNAVVEAARKKGCLIIHCPSGAMKLYAETPMRKLAMSAPKVKTKIPLQNWCYLDKKHEAALPIDDSDGGCDCQPRWRSRSSLPQARRTLSWSGVATENVAFAGLTQTTVVTTV